MEEGGGEEEEQKSMKGDGPHEIKKMGIDEKTSNIHSFCICNTKMKKSLSSRKIGFFYHISFLSSMNSYIFNNKLCSVISTSFFSLSFSL